MGLVRGSASITRFRITGGPETPDFDRHRFTEIPQASEIRESIGFVPFEPDAPYEVGAQRFVFRLRIDRRRPDATGVRERLRELVRIELESTGREFMGTKRRRELKELAEAELLSRAAPRSKIVEGCLDGRIAWIGTTGKNDLGVVVQALRGIGVLLDPLTPWADEPEDFGGDDAGLAREPGESVLGCRFLRGLLGDEEVMFEPVSGSVRLVTREAKVSLSGGVLPELVRYVEEGCEVVAAKLVVGDLVFRFDGPSFRVSSLKVETAKYEHWTGQLDERLERISGLFELLDGKFKAARRGLDAPPALAAVAG